MAGAVVQLLELELRVELVAGAVVQLLELELRVELEGEGGGGGGGGGAAPPVEGGPWRARGSRVTSSDTS